MYFATVEPTFCERSDGISVNYNRGEREKGRGQTSMAVIHSKEGRLDRVVLSVYRCLLGQRLRLDLLLGWLSVGSGGGREGQDGCVRILHRWFTETIRNKNGQRESVQLLGFPACLGWL